MKTDAIKQKTLPEIPKGLNCNSTSSCMLFTNYDFLRDGFILI